MLAPMQELRVGPRRDSRIRRFIVNHRDAKPIRRKTHYDLLYGQGLGIRVRLVGQRWCKYTDHVFSCTRISLAEAGGRHPLRQALTTEETFPADRHAGVFPGRAGRSNSAGVFLRLTRACAGPLAARPGGAASVLRDR